MALGNTLNILRPPDRSTPPIQTLWNDDLVKNMHNVLGQMAQQISAQPFGGLPAGATRPTFIGANTFWLDTSTSTDPIVKLFDGTDDITVMTFDYSANTVSFEGVLTSFDLVDDTSPQLGGDLDLNGNVITGLVIGTDVQAFDTSIATVIIKTADETVNNNDTLQDDDHLVFAMAANTTYLVELVLLLDSGSLTPDYKFGWTVPSGCTMLWTSLTGTGWDNDSNFALLTDSATNVAVSRIGTTGAKHTAIVRNGATAGNLQFQWAQDTAHASNSKLLKHSNMIVRLLGAT